MPITFACCQCQKSLRLRDNLAGKKIRCPDCRAVQVAPPLEEAEAGAAIRPRKTKKKRSRRRKLAAARIRREALQRVNVGLTFHYAGALVFMLSLWAFWVAVALLLLLVLAIDSPLRSEAEVIEGLARIGALLLLLSVGLTVLAGLLEIPTGVLGLWVPDAMALGFLICSLISRLLVPAGVVWLVLASAATLPAVVTVLVMFAGWVLWMAFLWRLAHILDEVETADSVFRLGIMAIFTMLAAVLVPLSLIFLVSQVIYFPSLVARLFVLLLLLSGVLSASYYQMARSGNADLIWKALVFPTGVPLLLRYLDTIGTLRVVLSQRT